MNLKRLIRVNKIISNIEYLSIVREIETLEKEREFCRHDMQHFISVARIAELLNIKEALDIDTELIYAAALLHDIGRAEEVKTGVRHEIESKRLAPRLIDAAGFDEHESEMILSAIANHRNKDVIADMNRPLESIIYRADKLSRNCFYCDAFDKCNKAYEKRNMELNI